MHFNKLGSSDNNMNLLTSTSSSASASPSSSSPVTQFTASVLPSSSATKTKTTTHGINLALWWLLFMAVILMAQQQPCECRYLPTRSHGDDLDKLRELMLQILESSNEDTGAQQQRPPPPNEANGNTYGNAAAAAAAAASQRANWLNKLGGSIDTMDVPRKYNNGPRGGIYDNGRYY